MQLLLEKFEPKFMKKGELLLEENQKCQHYFFIKQGLARTFYYFDGKDISICFTKEGEVITDIDSLFGNKSKYSIELLEDSWVYYLAYNKVEELFEKNQFYNRFKVSFTEKMFKALINRIEEFQFYSAKERYELLLKESPELLLRVSLKHISSFIGVAPESLSRIRGK